MGGDGDNLRLKSNTYVMQLILSHGDSDIIFSAFFYKIHHGGGRDERVIVITKNGMYVCISVCLSVCMSICCDI